MYSETAKNLKLLWRTPSGKLTVVCVAIVAAALLLLLVQSVFFANVLATGGWVLRLELLCLLLAAVFGGYVAEWMESREHARAAREFARSR